MNLEGIFSVYYYQVSQGCDKIDCKNVNCRSCSSFLFKNKEPNLIAMKLASEHWKNPVICQNLPIYIMKEAYLSRISKANSFISCILSNKAYKEEDYCSFIDIVTDTKSFPYIMLNKNTPIKPNDLLIDEYIFSDEIQNSKGKENFDKIIKPMKRIILTINKIINDDESTLSKIRTIIIAFFFSAVFIYNKDTIDNIARCICRFTSYELSIFVSFISKRQRILKYILKYIHMHLDNLVKKIMPYRLEIVYLVKTLEVLSHANSLNEDPLPYNIFQNECFSSAISPTKEFGLYCQKNICYINTTAVLTNNFKRDLLKVENRLIDSLLGKISIKFIIKRSEILMSSKSMLTSFECPVLLEKAKIKFAKEKGLDEGGVYREFVDILIRELTKKDLNLFVEVNNTLWISSKGMDLEAYKLFGIILAISLRKSSTVPITMNPIFFKKLANKKLTEKDFKTFNPEVYKGLIYLRKMDQEGQNIEDLMLDFTIDDNGTKNLVKGGKNIIVNNSNYEEYIELYINYFLVHSIQKNFKAIYDGFWSVCTPLIKGFNENDLESLICGNIEYDWKAFKDGFYYDDKYKKDSPTVINFWKAFFSLDESEKIGFLKFCTGSSRPTLNGLKDISIMFQYSSDTKLLPVAHTCSFILTFPDYKDYDIILKNIKICANYNEGMYIC